MNEQHYPEAAAAVVSKFLPAGLGALIMVAVDTPATKRELFWRIFVAFAATYLFGDVLFDFLQTFSLFAFLDAGKRAHTVAVDGVTGALGWFVLGGVSMWLRKFRADPAAAIRQAKDAVKP